MSPEYTAALAAHNAACKAFAEAQTAYRALTIGDAEFIEARNAYTEATKAYDAAYAKEQEADENAETPALNVAAQLLLF